MLLTILTKQESESTGADVFPPVLRVEPVKLRAILLRRKDYVGARRIFLIVVLPLKHGLHFCDLYKSVEAFVVLCG